MQKNTLIIMVLFIAGMGIYTGASAQAADPSSAQAVDDWTHFRGSRLDGIAQGAGYPVSWNDSLHIMWKADVPGRGWSSPVVLDGQVWVTSATRDGKKMFAECYSLEDGKLLYHVDLFHPDTIYRIHAVNSYSTPTSAIEKGFVYVHFGRYGTACISTASGDLVWQRTDMECEHIQGPGSSLLLHGNKLFVHMEGTDVQDIYALDKRTGETLWKAERDPELLEELLEIGKKAYVTPVVLEVNGRELLITNGSAACNAYDVETGEEVWVIPQGEDSTISMPVVYKGKVYFYTSFVTPPAGENYCELWAVDPRGEGDLTDQIIWRRKAPILQLLTPVIYNDFLYTVDTRANLECINVETGELVWTEKLRGKYNASPIVADGMVYVSDTRGTTIVFRAGNSFDKIAENQLPGEVWATPAFVDGTILMRTSEGLYRIGD